MEKIKEYLGEIVFGGIDGSITTFAVVAGATGASLDSSIVIILGFANLIADGFSMSVGNYLSNKAELDNYRRNKKREYWEIENLNETEKEEIRAIYRRKGFEGKLLEDIVEGITADKDRWVEDMMKNELEMLPKNKPLLRMSLVTFLSFFIIGLIPLLIYVFDYFIRIPFDLFFISSLLTAIGFILIGWLKTFVTETSAWRGILETLLLGALAATLAYYAGNFLDRIIS